jgi:DNA polymerase-3 subunit epsilon
MNMRSTNPRIVVLDTETTGLSPEQGHRIIEIGCVELVNRRLTGNRFHVYVNPERVIDDGAVAVHGITNEFLEDKPRFAGVAEDFLAFVQGAELVIHNAPFDVGFINHEFALLAEPLAPITEYCGVFDTLSFARQKHPGQRNSLDALCKRYGVDNSQRELHGALLDAEILADVYLLMTGGQFSLLDEASEGQAAAAESSTVQRIATDRPPLKVIACGPEELEVHRQRLAAIEKAGGVCLWKT